MRCAILPFTSSWRRAWNTVLGLSSWARHIQVRRCETQPLGLTENARPRGRRENLRSPAFSKLGMYLGAYDQTLCPSKLRLTIRRASPRAARGWTPSWAADSTESHVSVRGTARHRQDDPRPSVPAGGRPPRRARPLHHIVGNGGGASAGGESGTVGRSTASTYSSWCRRKPRWTRSVSSRSCIRPRWNSTKRPSSSSTVEKLNATRVVFDSLSELRLLAQSPLRYRRQVLALKHFFASRQCTVILLDDLTSAGDDLQLHSISHGVVLLEQLAIEYGAERRRLRIVKMRGIAFRGGYHDFVIRRGRPEVFPRLVAAEHHKPFVGEFAVQRQRGVGPDAGRRPGTRHQHTSARSCWRWQVLARSHLCDRRSRARRARRLLRFR